MIAPLTLPELFWRRVAESADQQAVWVKRAGVFRAMTWRQLADDVVRSSAALWELGVRPGERVAQVSENRYEWLTTDLAAAGLGAVHVPIHAPLSGEQIAWEVADSGAKLLVLSGPAQAAKLAGRTLPRVVTYDTCPKWDRLESFAANADFATAHARLQDFRRTLQPDDPATLLYTSGTTGHPRGVLLTHRNLTFDAEATLDAFGPRTKYRRLNFLPLSHIFARTCDWYVTLVGGSQMGIAESRETLFADLRAFAPEVLNGVPYFFDKVRRTLLERGDESAAGLQQLLGGEIKLCNSGGAALPGHVFDYYESRGVPLREGYGLTESSPVITLSTEDRFRRGSVGTAIPEVELRVAEDGEILTRGPHVMAGYWKDAAATAETIQDGWLHTGDLGRIDADGFLFVTGRRKELLVLASGKKVEPTQVEALLTADPLILQACVIGDGRNFLTALLVPNPDLLRSLIRRHRLWVFTRGQALRHRTVRGWFAARIEERLASLAPWEQVKKFTLLGRGFTPESGELTPKLSLRRQEVLKNCAAEIEALYRS